MPLNVKLSATTVLKSKAEVIALGVFESALAKQPLLAELHSALGSRLLGEADQAKFKGARGQVLQLPTLGLVPAKRLVLVGLGPSRAATNPAVVREFGACAARAAISYRSLCLQCPGDLQAPAVRAIAEGIGLGAYRFSRYFTGDRVPKLSLSQVEIARATKGTAAESRLLKQGLAVADAVALARDAINEPPNELVPEGLARLARSIAKSGKLKTKILDKKGIHQAGMHLHYAVGQGSVNEPRFIHLAYTPARPKKKLAFVGKGLTFDSGGLCIKPAAGMGDMKSDMGGAAAVLGLMAAVVALKPQVEVHAIVGAAENMPDAAAYRPGDVFSSLSGKSVEIINTDAEGRLVLADALTYASRLKPDLIVDAATLTGACLVALGKACSAYYAADDALSKRFADAAASAGEQFWRMPLLEDIKEQLKSGVADLKHTGERWGGSISAALFLREFVDGCAWMHCDVAGPVLAERARGIHPKGGTGHAVLTFLHLVESYA